MSVPAQKYRTFKEDHSFGKEGEEMLESVLKRLTPHQLIHTECPMAAWDWIGIKKGQLKFAAESKRRHQKSHEWPTTMLKYLKVERASKLEIPVWFIFIFDDSIWGIQYNKELFDTYPTDIRKLPDRVDYIEKEEKRIYIPMKDMTCFLRMTPKPLFLEED